VRRVIVIMEHNGPGGVPKLLHECALPLTGKGVVNRIITDLCVLDITPEGFEVLELADGVTEEMVEKRTGAPVHLAEMPAALAALLSRRERTMGEIPSTARDPSRRSSL
jgi:3-oxoacid CoA-transferase subunit B